MVDGRKVEEQEHVVGFADDLRYTKRKNMCRGRKQARENSNVRTPRIEIVKRVSARMQRAARVAAVPSQSLVACGRRDLIFFFFFFFFIPCELQSDETT